MIGKTNNGFAPIGPYIVTSDLVGDPNSLKIECLVNGAVRQSSNTNDMVFNCAQIVSYASKLFALEAGDIIFTGTPEGVIAGYPKDKQVWLKPGERLVTRIEKLGNLEFALSCKPIGRANPLLPAGKGRGDSPSATQDKSVANLRGSAADVREWDCTCRVTWRLLSKARDEERCGTPAFRARSGRPPCQSMCDIADRLFRLRFQFGGAGRLGAQRLQRAFEHADLRREHAEKHRDLLRQDEDGGKGFNVQVARPVGVVFDIDPDKAQGGFARGQRGERIPVAVAGAAPRRAQAYDRPLGCGVGRWRNQRGHA